MIAVIVVNPGHELAPDQGESMVDRRGGPDIFRKTNDLEANINIALEDFCSPIARRIVNHDDLNRKPAIQPADAVQTLIEIAFAIEDIDDD